MAVVRVPSEQNTKRQTVFRRIGKFKAANTCAQVQRKPSDGRRHDGGSPWDFGGDFRKRGGAGTSGVLETASRGGTATGRGSLPRGAARPSRAPATRLHEGNPFTRGCHPRAPAVPRRGEVGDEASLVMGTPTSLSSAGVPVSTCSGPRPTESPERKKVCVCVPMCTCVHTLRPVDTSPTGRVIPAGTRVQSTRREGGCEGRSTGCSRVSCTGEAEDRHVWWPGERNAASCGPAGRLPTSPAPSVCSRCLALPGQGRALPSHALPSDGDRTTRTPSAPACPHYPTGCGEPEDQAPGGVTKEEPSPAPRRPVPVPARQPLLTHTLIHARSHTGTHVCTPPTCSHTHARIHTRTCLHTETPRTHHAVTHSHRCTHTHTSAPA